LQDVTTEMGNLKINHMNEFDALRMELDELNKKTEAQLQAAGESQRNIINGLMN
jgi:hypothetical protein